jgi:prenyltransferase beta subunit
MHKNEPKTHAAHQALKGNNQMTPTIKTIKQLAVIFVLGLLLLGVPAISLTNPAIESTLPNPFDNVSLGELSLADSLSSFTPNVYHAPIPQRPNPQGTIPESLSFGNLLFVYGDFINESGQEPIEVWITLLENMGFNATSIYINALPTQIDYDLLIITPSVGTSNASYGVSQEVAQIIGATPCPILLLGFAHEVLDQLWGFNPLTDFVASIERYLWTSDAGEQFLTLPHEIPHVNERFSIYSHHISYDAYRLSVLPKKVEVLGSNALGSGAQLFWFRALPQNPHIYYWGLDQVAHLSSDGIHFFENLIHWLIRPVFQQRLGSTLTALQLTSSSPNDYWAVQGLGGFGYPLEPSLSFTYYVVDLVETYGLPVNISTFGTWVLSCYDPFQGCFQDLSSPQLHDRCITTSMSVLTAQSLGILNQLDQIQIGNYIAECQDPITGGFFTELGGSQTNLKATHFAIEALSKLDQLSKIDNAAAIAYIVACQETDTNNPEFGGFYSDSGVGLNASLVYVLDALIALDKLGAIDSINQTALLEFLTACEDPKGSDIFDTKIIMDSDEWVLGTASAIHILDILDSIGLIDILNSRAFILANQFPNGGWGRGDTLHDFHNSPDETWYAVHSLALTGGLSNTNTSLTEYLNSCCSIWGGATEPTVFGDFLTSTHILSALYYGDALSAFNLTAFLAYLDTCWSSTRISFCSHQLPSIVGTDTDTPTPDRMVIETGTFGPLYHYSYSLLTNILNITGTPWLTRNAQIRQEIEACQTNAPNYMGMFGYHHLYVGRESDLTFRFDTTCWSLIAHAALGGQPGDLINATNAYTYLQGCLHENGTHQFFHDSAHSVSFPAPWRAAEEHLADTLYGLQAYAYLDPNLTGLDGQKLATYASAFLLNDPTIITSYYATEILFLLVETGLYSEAISLLNWDDLKTSLLNVFTFEGRVKEPTLPPHKWTPYLVDLALQLANRLSILSQLDVNPVLELIPLNLPNGTYSVGDSIEFSGMVSETRWDLTLNNISIGAFIFGCLFLNSCHSSQPRYWELHESIPAKSNALGIQNLILVAIAPGAIPWYKNYYNTCEVWGNIALLPTYTPDLQVPRSIPLNMSLQLTLEGAISDEGRLTNGNLSITLETTADIYYPIHKGNGRYEVIIPTNNFVPLVYLFRINATVPYCLPYTTTDYLSIILFDTYFTIEQLLPSNPVLSEQVTQQVGLWSDYGVPLIGYQIQFTITRPGETYPILITTEITDESGLATCSWIPDTIGQWNITFTFNETDMYHDCIGSTYVYINQFAIATPSLTLTIDPLEVEDPYLTPLILIDIQLNYMNGTSTQGLLANITLQLIAQDSTIFLEIVLTTNQHGQSQFSIPTPQPGLYAVIVSFKGAQGFAPCSQSMSLLVKTPPYPFIEIFSPLGLLSLAIMLIGLLLYIIYFLRNRVRFNRFMQPFRPNCEILPDASHSLRFLLADQENQSSNHDDKDRNGV